MYQIDDVIVYGRHGVCRIIQIEPKVFAGEEHLYYDLKPVYDDRSTFFVPAENELSAKKLRPLITKEEIHTLITTIPNQENIAIIDFKHRKEAYQKIIEGGDRQEIMRLIKTLHERKIAQQKAGKKPHLIDERFLKEAETVLYEEIAYVLELERDAVLPYIQDQLAKQAK